MQSILENLHPVVGALSAYPYIALFMGMLVAGEVVLLPAIFLATAGRLDLPFVICVSVIATLISDLLWYCLGRLFPAATVSRLSGRIGENYLDGVQQAFSRGGKRILFMSKFVYGTRTIVQVLAGVHGMVWTSYILVNTAGVLAVTAVLTALSYLVMSTAYRLDDVVQNMEMAFLMFAVITVAGFFLFSRKMKQRWTQ
ncbi:MAG: DedA family protein [Pseudohongiella sp.]|nr:DedA family protein [Pseudohongiella sp.]MDO9519678.1 DedA family protein [Pseudohongiella sp.]MDP2128244.1 DedA family protein [Pseudohongiella sp.]